MTSGDFRFIQSFMLRKTGMTIWSEKRYLVEKRLSDLAADMGLGSEEEVITRVRDGTQGIEMRVIEALLPTDTLFFRDLRPFDQLDTVLVPAMITARSSSRRLRVWCCATGTGQEAYSVAMVLARHADALAGWSIDLLGTDLSPAAIARAKAGRYDHFEVQRGLPVRELIQHFTREGEDWTISPAMRRAVRFDTVNLAHETVAGPFDIVLCRNLLLHLDTHVKRALLDRIANVMAQDAALMLGATESVIGLSSRLLPDPANPGLYRRSREPVTGLQRLAAIA